MQGENSEIIQISEFGEFGLIKRLTEGFPVHHPGTIVGVGDDGAVISPQKKQTVISTDLLLEGIHFDLVYTPLKHLGYKSIVVNLSDIFAMNATPRQVLVSIGVSGKFSVAAIDQIYEGIKTACQFYGIDLIGGDTSASLTGLVISVTAIGEADPEDIVLRSGAKPGELLCLTGDIGGAYVGLQLLEREKRIYLDNQDIQPDLEEKKHILERQLKPEARKDIIDWLRDNQIKPTAMIDVSDGLSSDVLHLCNQSNVGCLIFEENLPIHQETYHTALKFGLSPTTCAMNGGEDYELLFSIDPKHLAIIDEQLPDIRVIGKILPKEEGCHLFSKAGQKHALIAQGWKAF